MTSTGQPMTFRQQMDGFPWAQVIVVGCVRFAEPIAFTSLFTYVFFMVEDFGIAQDKAEISTYAGYLSSAFAFCQVLTGFNWGRAADRYGRKPILFCGLIGTMIALLFFGFSKNYMWALIARCMMGLVNGNVAVIRTLLGEIGKEKKHQGLIFATMPMVYQMGSVVGPLVGGYLSGKDTKVGFLKPFVERYPYALPNIVVGFVILLSTTISLLFLEETHWKYKYRHDYFVDFGDHILSKFFRLKTPERPWHSGYMRDDDDEATDGLLMDDLSGSNEDLGEEGERDKTTDSVNTRLSGSRSRASLDTQEPHSEMTYKDLFTSHIFYAIMCNFCLSLHQVVYNEFLPIFLSQQIFRDPEGRLTSVFPFKIVGGLSYSSADTGTLLSTTGITGTLIILAVLPYVNRTFKTLQIYKKTILIFPLVYITVPYIVFLADHLMAAKFIVYAITAVRVLGLSLTLPQVLVIIHENSPARHRAFVNGATASAASSARCIGPFIWGLLMSWGQKLQIAWLGWWCLAAVSLLAAYQTRYLKEVGESEDEEEDEALE